MDRTTFNKELAKYKIVRLEDHYIPRMKSRRLLKASEPEVPSSSSAHHVESKAEKVKVPVVDESTMAFWEMMDKICTDLLTSEEKQKFLSEMKQHYSDVHEWINLEDLDYSAQLIQ